MNKRIKLIRNHFGFTQAQLAEKLGLSQNFIAQLETGKKNMSTRTVAYMCDMFNINENWFNTGEGEMFKPAIDERALYISYLLENVDDPIANAIMHFMEIYLELDEKDKIVLRNLIEKLSSKRTED